MKPFTIDDGLSVGNEHIDGQHRDLIQRFAWLSRCQPADFGPERRIHADISDLIIAITRYFIDEEELMIRNGYPNYEAHAQEHATFVEQLSQTLKVGKNEVLCQHIPSLTEQMIKHLTTTDMEFRAYLMADTKAS